MQDFVLFRFVFSIAVTGTVYGTFPPQTFVSPDPHASGLLTHRESVDSLEQLVRDLQ